MPIGTVIIAVLMGLGIMMVSLWAIRMLATPVPEGPDPDDVVEVAMDYTCTLCGMRLTVTHAQGEEMSAPRHCREEMVESI